MTAPRIDSGLLLGTLYGQIAAELGPEQAQRFVEHFNEKFWAVYERMRRDSRTAFLEKAATDLVMDCVEERPADPPDGPPDPAGLGELVGLGRSARREP